MCIHMIYTMCIHMTEQTENNASIQICIDVCSVHMICIYTMCIHMTEQTENIVSTQVSYAYKHMHIICI